MQTVNELNAIQAEWMKLDFDAPESEKQRVFALMDKMPKSYITGSNGNFNVMHSSSPHSGTPLTLDQAKKIASQYGYRTDIAWNCKGEFISI